MMLNAVLGFFSWIFSWLTSESTVQGVKVAASTYTSVATMINRELGF